MHLRVVTWQINAAGDAELGAYALQRDKSSCLPVDNFERAEGRTNNDTSRSKVAVIEVKFGAIHIEGLAIA